MKNGELIIESFSSVCGLKLGEAAWKDYTVSVKTKIVKHQPTLWWTEGAGIGLRYSPTFKLYSFALCTMGFSAKGDEFKFYVDNELVLDYEDNVHPTGEVDIGVSYAQTTAHFDDFVVTGDDVPDLDLSVSPKGKLTIAWGEVKQDRYLQKGR